MAILDQIIQMKRQGFNESQIIQNLKEQGISPREINEAIDQSNVKSAVYPVLGETGGMQPSMMQPSPQEQFMLPLPEQAGRQVTQPMTQETGELPQPQEGAYTAYPEPYAQYPQYPETGYGYAEYQYPPALDTETITDIAQQVADEKLEKVNKQIQNLSKFKSLTEGRILDIDARLRRIETSIDRLQTSILGKIGDYSREMSNLKAEMETTQESFSKILEPLKKIAGEPTRKTASSTASSMTKTEEKRGKPRPKVSKDGFENYLR